MSVCLPTKKDARIERVRTALELFKMPEEIDQIIQIIEEILILKDQKNAEILGHNYMVPEVFYGVSDFVGDSLALAQKAAKTNSNLILFNGVHFMAETAKILSPDKTILIADLKASCSLAESLDGAGVRELRRQYPGVPIVSYINCTAEVKAEVDVICTSANAVKVVNSLNSDRVIMVPDGYLADNVQKETNKKIISWAGKCMVHELFTPFDIDLARKNFPGIKIIAHPECSEEVSEKSDFTGSTTQMSDYIKETKSKKVMLMTECSMSDNLQSEFPSTQFVSTCQACPHMKRITLDKILKALQEEHFSVEVDLEIAGRAKISLERMLEIGR